MVSVVQSKAHCRKSAKEKDLKEDKFLPVGEDEDDGVLLPLLL